jgi:hypothetical protein
MTSDSQSLREANRRRMRAFEERFENLSPEDHKVANLAFEEMGCYLCDVMALGGETELHPDIVNVLLVSLKKYMDAAADQWQGYLSNRAPASVARQRADIVAAQDRSKLN